MQTLVIGKASQSLKKSAQVESIAAIYGYPPQDLYGRFLNVHAILRRDVQLPAEYLRKISQF